MDPINRLNGVLEALRRQIAESARRMDADQTATNRSTDTTQSQTAPKPTLGELKNRIRERLKTIDNGDVSHKRGRRIFLESVLSWEFGDEVLADPRFHEIIDNVQDTIAADPDTDRQFALLLEELRRA